MSFRCKPSQLSHISEANGGALFAPFCSYLENLEDKSYSKSLKKEGLKQLLGPNICVPKSLVLQDGVKFNMVAEAPRLARAGCIDVKASKIHRSGAPSTSAPPEVSNGATRTRALVETRQGRGQLRVPCPQLGKSYGSAT